MGSEGVVVVVVEDFPAVLEKVRPSVTLTFEGGKNFCHCVRTGGTTST
jgi:hypothetical protein